MASTTDENAGPEQFHKQMLKQAVLADLDTPEGKSLRASVVAMHVEQARDLVLRSVNVPAAEAELLKEEARKTLALAVLVERLQLQVARPAAAASECLLDPPPDAPRDVIAATTLLGAKVRWVAPNDHGKPINQRYEIGISPKPALLAPVVLSGTEAQITGLAIGTSYTFTVVATNDDGKGPVSMASNPVKIGTPAPNAPTGVSAVAQGAGQQVNWTAGSGGGTPTSHLVRAYDSTKPGTVVSEQTVDGASRQVIFGALAKGSYIFGVRPFGDGGFGEEAQSAVVQHAPAPTLVIPDPYTRPGLPKPDSLMLFDLGEAANNILDPSRLRLRMKPITEKAAQWRYDHLKELAINAARETIGYDQLLAQLMQMTVGKVLGAQAALGPTVLDLIKKTTSTLSTVQNLTKTDTVKGILQKVGDAAATALALEGLIHFLIDNQPLAFWTGLFDGLIGDISNFDTGLSRTDRFLNAYFEGLGSDVIKAIQALIGKVQQTVHDVVGPLTDSVAQLQKELGDGVRFILKELEETVVTATSVATGPDGTQVKTFLGNESMFNAVTNLTGLIVDEVRKLEADLIDLVNAAIGNPNNLVVSLIKDFIVYPILGIMVVSFAGGPIAGWILSGIIAALGIELIRQVARWLTGPLLGVLGDVEAKVNDAVKELQGVLQKVIDIVPSPAAELQFVAANLAGLAHLLPQQFLKDVGALVSGARSALLSQASELALTAERALGLENATAFDILQPGYSSNLTQAPDLPGGVDKSLFAGMAVLRDFHLLEGARAQVLNAKETVVTLRMSLFKLLGGLGSPATFAGEAANLFQTFLKGGSLLLNLDEQTLVEQGFPGLYRALVVDVKPIGLLSAVSSTVPILPNGIPLTITHMGCSRIRVKREANPKAPPILLPSVLSLPLSDVLGLIATEDDTGKAGKFMLDFVDDLVAAGVPPDFDPSAVDLNNMGFRARMHDLVQGMLTAQLSHLLDPAVSLSDISQVVSHWLNGFAPTIVQGDGYAYFGLPSITPNWRTNDDTGRNNLRAAIKQECLAQLDNVPRTGVTGYFSHIYAAASMRSRLKDMIATGRNRELPKWAPRVAKWGGARFDRERDPQVEARGFVTLVQDFGLESAAFNLLPDIAGGVTGVLGGAAAAFATANPARAYDSERQANQYRAFENRGVEGQWLLNLESALNPGTLIDLLLEFTVRGCYDDGLAAAVKASRQQSSLAFNRAQAVASSVNKTLRYPGSLPLWDVGLGPVKTIRYSLRAHRENILKNALAAADALGNALAPDGLKLAQDLASLDRSKLPLQLMEPLRGIGPNTLNTFTLQFQKTQSNSPLSVLHQLLPISPADFGLGGTDAPSKGTVEGFSFVVVPSGAKTSDGLPKELLKNVAIHPKLLPLLPQFDPAKPVEYQLDPAGVKGVSASAAAILAKADPKKLPPQNYLFMARSPSTTAVTLSDLFGGTGTSALFDFGDAIDTGHIYDVIFSISVRTPVPQLTVSPSVVAI